MLEKLTFSMANLVKFACFSFKILNFEKSIIFKIIDLSFSAEKIV